jgi:hypothetical protein
MPPDPPSDPPEPPETPLPPCPPPEPLPPPEPPEELPPPPPLDEPPPPPEEPPLEEPPPPPVLPPPVPSMLSTIDRFLQMSVLKFSSCRTKRADFSSVRNDETAALCHPCLMLLFPQTTKRMPRLVPSPAANFRK